ncbi:hypothetical protein [Streptoalloteichus tenebrarius]|uniref:hypothetical protein n=1 Tax=Streptoalloteichus tenebrarius (strain ATCC 17920 / DSM 40477 / JCM 4838 / CBS 697.72 / NBRC 16177 / NCIMB 11028 / NRRL B-12390 / A12253. 1 / ISP 5477) TaxID=1933 RepID=UPI0020A4BFB0|nr:hypothetical protein [Streptoalloteichus tenebrarius]
MVEQVADYRQRMGIDPNRQVPILRIPPTIPDPNNPGGTMVPRMSTPVNQLPPEHRVGIADTDTRPIGEVLGLPMDDPETANSSVYQQATEGVGGGAYLPQSEVLFLAEGQPPQTLFHEMGHIRQHQDGHTNANTEITVLEYHNVLNNENRLDPDNPRERYTVQDSMVRRFANVPWETVEQHVNNLPPERREHTAQLLNEIRQQTEGMGEQGERIRRNFIAEYCERNNIRPPSKWNVR